jgi:aryl-alcohol dehydrogenase-like predicted oxidoreductase
MLYRQLGKTGLQVSEISLGCAGFWGSRRFPEATAEAIVLEAFERGINLFDTGHNYSNFNAEPRLGRILRQILSRHPRSRLVVSSKAGTLVPAGSLLPTRWRRQKDFSPDYIEQSCAESIRNLQCGYLDIFQLHDIDVTAITPRLLERLQRMRQQGMYRHLGIYTHQVADARFLAALPDLVEVVLTDFNLLQLAREPFIDALARAGIGVLAGTVLAQGHLLQDRVGSLRSRADAWYLARALLQPNARRLARTAATMRAALAGVREMSAAQAAFARVLHNPAIASCVFGTTRLEHLREVVDASGRRLEPQSLQLLG